jgi:hypothetical protein
MKQFKTILFAFFTLTALSEAKAQHSEFFLHEAVDTTVSGYVSTIHHERLDGTLNMFPVFTHNFNPGGGQGKYQEDPLGLKYAKGKWQLYNETLESFVNNTSYNILIPGSETTSWVHITTPENSTNNYTLVDHPKMNDKPEVKLFVCHMNNPTGAKGNSHPHHIGVFYSLSEKKWAVYNEDLVKMDGGLAFNIVLVDSSSDLTTMEHVVDGENLKDHLTILDHKDLNNNPDAKIVVSHRYNSADKGSGKYNNHSIGVYYNGANWAIYNEDKANMPIGIIFNVAIKNQNQTASNRQIMKSPPVRIGPNPVVQGQPITIGLFNESKDKLLVQVLDMNGRVVKEQSLISGSVVLEKVSTVDLKQGVYVLQIHGAKTRVSKRLIIK